MAQTKDIINELIKIRREKRLTQYVVYCDTGIHVGRLESCKSDIKISTLLLLLRYYNFNMEEFLLRIA